MLRHRDYIKSLSAPICHYPLGYHIGTIESLYQLLSVTIPQATVWGLYQLTASSYLSLPHVLPHRDFNKSLSASICRYPTGYLIGTIESLCQLISVTIHRLPHIGIASIHCQLLVLEQGLEIELAAYSLARAA